MITVKMAIAIAKAKINQSGVPCSFIHARGLCSVLQWHRWKNFHLDIWFRPLTRSVSWDDGEVLIKLYP